MNDDVRITEESMSRGFVTVATGKENYYVAARNLLRSYRRFAKEPMPFAIIADAENDYTQEFDRVIVLENAQRSYMDKLSLLKKCPFDENIFVESDCLAYGDLNAYWDYFEGADDFSCFGQALPFEGTGWFKKGEVAEYNDKIHFIPQFHGGIYYIRKGEKLDAMHDLCVKITGNYDRYKFILFNDQPADETVLALAMAVLNLRPHVRISEKIFLFAPQAGNKYFLFIPGIQYPKVDIISGKARNKTPQNEKTENILLVHWSSRYTYSPRYRLEAEKLDALVKGKKINIINKLILMLKFMVRVPGFVFSLISSRVR